MWRRMVGLAFVRNAQDGRGGEVGSVMRMWIECWGEIGVQLVAYGGARVMWGCRGGARDRHEQHVRWEGEGEEHVIDMNST